MGITVTSLKYADAQAIAQIKGVAAVTAYVRGVQTVSWQNQKIDTTYVGVTSAYPQVESIELARGNFFGAQADQGISRQAVLGWQVWQDLFGNQNPIGRRIKIKRESFRVVGVIKKRGVQGFQNQDKLVFIPLRTAQKLLLGINHVNIIRLKANSAKQVPLLMRQIRQILRERHKIAVNQDDDFSLRATNQALAALDQVTQALKFFLVSIAAISLLVGGIGIMNIMLVTVNERIYEVGLRKAIGATKSDIRLQFLTESVILTVLGGFVGILIGILLSSAIALIANYLGYNWDFVISFFSIALSVGVSALAGILFGWYPAHKASQLEPIQALRYE